MEVNKPGDRFEQEDDRMAEKEKQLKAEVKQILEQAETAALYGAIHARAGDTEFLGYDGTEAQGRVVAIV